MEALIDCTKDDMPNPPPLEKLEALASISLGIGCRDFGLQLTAEFGAVGQEPVLRVLQNQIIGKVYDAGMVIDYDGKKCLITSLFLRPPPNFLERQDAYDRLHEFQVRPGRKIPVDASVQSLSLLDVACVEDLGKV